MCRRWLHFAAIILGVCCTRNIVVAASHWAFEPVTVPQRPSVSNANWCRTPIDYFVLEKLEAAELAPSPQAETYELVRRIYFDLSGLPPTAAEADEFERLYRMDSTATVRWLVEKLLASPQYGERWGRWWLDAARYADTNGQDENKVMANAWRYRDWVIRSFNANKPFDDFITEQIAGDLLPATENEHQRFDHLIATGFLVLGPKMLAEQDKPKLVMDIVDEQIDTVGRAFLGLTLGCARCHDHKFDPVTARDYYAMAGIFKSTRTMADLAFVSKFNETQIATKVELERINEYRQRLLEQTNKIENLIKAANQAIADCEQKEVSKEPRSLYPAETRVRLEALEKERDNLVKAAPPAAATALAVCEDKPVDIPIHLRGSHLNLAKEPVPRGFIQAVACSCIAPEIPTNESGRLQLAEWLTAPENPLTARVIVNRIWQAHFGEGLVRTPENFGLRGSPPTDPKLLDWLADHFVRSGWDTKALHRLIITSAVYQQSGHTTEMHRRVDPENHLLTRFPRQRLEAEMVRDALLAVSGRLDCRMGGSLVNWTNNEYTPGDEVSAVSARRTVYLPIVRDRLFDALTIFDFANPSVCTAQRTPTVVSHQALFFLNSPLVKSSSETLATSLQSEACSEQATQVREAYKRILNRHPTEAETLRALSFIASSENPGGFSEFCQTLFASNEFIYRY